MNGITIFLSFFLFSAGLIFLMLNSSVKNLFIDNPDARKIHQKPVPRLGGAGFAFAFFILTALLVFFNRDFRSDVSGLLMPIYAAGIIVVITGMLDDCRFFHIRVSRKLAAEGLAALILVFVFKVHFGRIGIYGDLFLPEWAGILLALVWIIGVINAVNIIDGIDGLAAGISLIAFITISYLGYRFEIDSVFQISFAVTGVVFGFLLFNWYPAKTFMGDSGSLFLGVLLSILSITTVNKIGAQPNILIASLFIGVPVLDVFIAMVRRYFKSRDKRYHLLHSLKSMIVADNNHIHHRLLYREYTHIQISVFLYMLSFGMCVTALVLVFVSPVTKMLVLAYWMFSLILILNRLRFGGRFKKILGVDDKMISYSDKKDRTIIGVAGADAFFKKFLENFHGDNYRFLYFNFNRIKQSVKFIDKLIIYCRNDPGIEEDIFLPDDNKSDSSPIYIVPDDNMAKRLEASAGRQINVLSMSKMSIVNDYIKKACANRSSHGGVNTF